MKSWHSSTSPAPNACAARVGPPTVKSLAADVFMSRTESGSKRRSSPVLEVETTCEIRLGSQGRLGLPDGHRFVQAPSIEVGTDGAHKVSDEGEDLVDGRGPFEAAVRVLDVAVKGHIRHIDQLGHAAPQAPA